MTEGLGHHLDKKLMTLLLLHTSSVVSVSVEHPGHNPKHSSYRAHHLKNDKTNKTPHWHYFTLVSLGSDLKFSLVKYFSITEKEKKYSTSILNIHVAYTHKTTKFKRRG